MQQEFFTGNRERLAELLDNGSVAIFLSGLPQRRAGDQYYHFEVDRNFFYLTGLKEPNLGMLISKKDTFIESTLLLPPVNERMERSNGSTLRPEDVTKTSGIANVLYGSIDQRVLEILASGSGRSYSVAYLDFFVNPGWDNPQMVALAGSIRSGCPYARIKNANPLVNGLRFIKQPEEVAAIRQAIALTDKGLQNALRHLSDGRPEYEVRLDFEDPIFRTNEGLGFTSIVAAAKNSTTLHHEPGASLCHSGDMVLFDVGAHVEFYSADISRTYPISGKFSVRQRQIYEIVLQMQYECIAMMKSGAGFKDVEDTCRGVAVREMIKAGIIADEDEATKHYYHGCCHPLGLFTHDVHAQT